MAAQRKKETTDGAVAAPEEQLEDLDEGEGSEGEGEEGSEEEEVKKPDEYSVEPEEKSRKERRRERGAIWKENERLRQENREIAERLARLEGMASQIPDPVRLAEAVHGKTRPDPVDEELSGVYAQQDALLGQYVSARNSGKLTPEEDASYTKKFRELDAKKHQLYIQRSQPAPQQPNPVAAIQAMILAQYRDVAENQDAYAWAQARYVQLRTKEKAPDSWDTISQAMEEAREGFGLKRGSHRPPGENTRRRYSGAPTGAGAKSARTIVLTEAQKKMADAVYKYMKNPQERYQRWANEVGKELLDEG
jgi:hypothetical protein